MSLSPRPERFTRKILPLAAGARLMASATACADSSAGMMPSVRESRRAASSASPIGGGHVFGAAAGRAARRAPGRSWRNPGRPKPSASARPGRSRPAAGSCRRLAARRARRRGSAPRGRPARRRARRLPRRPARTRGVGQEGVEDADGVAAAAHAGEDGVRQAAFGFENLARALPRRSPSGNRAPSWGRDARRAPSRAGNRCRRRWSPSRAWPR